MGQAIFGPLAANGPNRLRAVQLQFALLHLDNQAAQRAHCAVMR
jgi:hypothetical protein